MDHFAHRDLEIDISEENGRVRVDLCGKSNDRAPEAFLAPIFETVVVRAAAHGATIELHFEKLQYFNSATMGALIGFLRRVRDGDPRLAVVLIYDEGAKLQKVSLEALRIFDVSGGFLRLEPRSFPTGG